MAGPVDVTLDLDATKALAVSLCPSGDLDLLQKMLEEHSDSIKQLHLSDPKRQLLAALRLRARYISGPFYAKADQQQGLDCWLRMQSGRSLDA